MRCPLKVVASFRAPKEQKMSTAVQTASSPERQTNATQTALIEAVATSSSDQSVQMSLIESQFSKVGFSEGYRKSDGFATAANRDV